MLKLGRQKANIVGIYYECLDSESFFQPSNWQRDSNIRISAIVHFDFAKRKIQINEGICYILMKIHRTENK